jgi:hypothetical protein
MKKRISSITVAVAVAVVAAWGFNQSTNEVGLSAVALSNVEALASAESSGSNLQCWSTVSTSGAGSLTYVTYCGDCSAVIARSWSNSNGCAKS